MAITQAQLQAQIDAALVVMAGYMAELAIDSEKPWESYSIDGESPTTNEWREGLLRQVKGLREEITELQALMNALFPYIVRTRHRL